MAGQDPRVAPGLRPAGVVVSVHVEMPGVANRQFRCEDADVVIDRGGFPMARCSHVDGRGRCGYRDTVPLFVTGYKVGFFCPLHSILIARRAEHERVLALYGAAVAA